MNEQQINQAFSALGFNAEGEDLVRTAETVDDFARVHGTPAQRIDGGARWTKRQHDLYVVDCGDYRLAWCSNDATFRRR